MSWKPGRPYTDLTWVRKSAGDLRIDYGDYNKPIMLRPGEEYHASPQPELSYLHCRCCDCDVEMAPTCSQCGAPLKNPACNAPTGYLTSWSI